MYHYGRVAAGVVRRHRVRVSSAGSLHALATVWFGVDHIVSGVAINIIAVGRHPAFSPRRCSAALPGGGPTQSPSLDKPPAIDIAFIAEPMNTLEGKHWFVVSDLASFVEMLTSNPRCSRCSAWC